MYSKHGSDLTSPFTSSALMTAFVAALAAAGVAMGMANAVKSLGRGESVTVDFSNVTWWTQIEFGLEKADDSPATLVVSPVAGITAAGADSGKKNVQAVSSIPQNQMALAKSTAPAPHKAIVKKPLSFRTPAHKQGFHRLSPATPVPRHEEIVARVGATAEAQKMQSLHSLLQRNFRVAMITHPPKPVDTQFVHVIPATLPVTDSLLPRHTGHPQWVRKSIQDKKTAASSIPTVGTVAVATPGAITFKSQLKDRVATQSASIVSALPSHFEPGTAIRQGDDVSLQTPLQVLADTQLKKVEVKVEPNDGGAIRLSKEEKSDSYLPSYVGMSAPIQFNQQIVTTQSAGAAARALSTPIVTAQKPATVIASNGYPTPSAMNSQVGYSMAKSLKLPSAPVGLPSNDLFKQGPDLNRVLGIEAFDWKTPVYPVSGSLITHEGIASGQQARWIRVNSNGYLDTIAWYHGTVGETVPLISQSTASLLSRLSGASFRNDVAVIYGTVSIGWSINLSGRAEKPVCVDGQNNSISCTSVELERHFAFVNVAPGSHLLTLSDPTGMVQGAVALPALEGAATYVAAVSPKLALLSGTVFDAGSDTGKALRGVTTRVVGQPSKSTVTDEQGRFTLSKVAILGDYPLFIEADGYSGFTHRYRVSASSTTGLNLFTFSKRQIDSWLNQLEGGISAQSGLAVGALPAVSQMYSGDSLYPSVDTLTQNATLLPEAYSIDSAERLQVQDRIDVQRGRFLSVQIPEGLNTARIQDQDKKQAWSELIFASPGVINVLGPLN